MNIHIIIQIPEGSLSDMPTSGNTNLYFEAHKPVFFNKNLYFF